MQWRTLQNDLVENYKKELPTKLKLFDDFLGGKQFSAGDNVSKSSSLHNGPTKILPLSTYFEQHVINT